MGQRINDTIQLFIAISCWMLGIFGLLGISLFGWILRDGLGPDSVDSHGWLALRRFIATAGWPLLVPMALLVSGTLLYRRTVRRGI